MLQGQIHSQLEDFRQTGGFTENMTAERLEARKAQAMTAGAPVCPKCGKPMLRRMQRKGQMQGREFWGAAAIIRDATASSLWLLINPDKSR